MDIIKVSANSRTSAVAGAIAGVIREHKHAEVQAIGAGAVNQAIKALIVATGYLKGDGIDVVCVPEFVDVQIEDMVRTAIKLVVDPRPKTEEFAPAAHRPSLRPRPDGVLHLGGHCLRNQTGPPSTRAAPPCRLCFAGIQNQCLASGGSAVDGVQMLLL